MNINANWSKTCKITGKENWAYDSLDRLEVRAAVSKR